MAADDLLVTDIMTAAKRAAAAENFIDWLHDEAFRDNPMASAELRTLIEDHFYKAGE